MKPTDEEIKDKASEMFEPGEGWLAWVESAKWARDQQPKLNVLKWKATPHDIYFANTPFGAYKVIKNSIGESMWIFQNEEFNDCHSIDHGKQLAQADYERRVNELYI